MALALAETPLAQQATGTSIARTYTAVNAGDLMIAGFVVQHASANIGLPSGWTNDSGIFTLAGTTQGLIASKIAGAGESTTVTITSDQNVVLNLTTWRYSGAAASSYVDKHPTPTAGVLNSIQPGPTGDLSQPNEVAIAMAITPTNNGGTEAIDSGFTIRAAATHNRCVVGDLITSATTSLNPTLSWATSLTCGAAIVTYKEAGGASTVPASMSGTWGGWSGTANATVTHPAVMSGIWGGWSGTMAAQVNGAGAVETGLDANIEKIQALCRTHLNKDLNGALRAHSGLNLDANGVCRALFGKELNACYDELIDFLTP